MLDVERPLQVGACACNWKVIGTVELFVGVVMTTLCDETLMLKSVSQNAPVLPKAFRRRRWLLADVLTFWLMDGTLITVSVLLSTKYALLFVLCPPQVDA